MNEYQLSMFRSLEALVASSESFYRQEYVLDGKTYWIYNYRLASYSDFQQPGGVECRGHMFEVSGGEAVRLAALPMQKFFNLNENPLTMNLDLSLVDTVELKADGSLISTFTHNDQLRLKTKGSLFSEQAIAAQKWLSTHPQYERMLASLDALGWTVNMEWCAPDNRIVIGYPSAHLKILNARNRFSGEYMNRDTLVDVGGVDHVISRVDTRGMSVGDFVRSIPDMQDDIEGYVCRIGSLWFKVKTNKYMSLHHAKDSINNPRRLFEAILDEGVDDLRSMFAHDPVAIATIDAMQEKVTHMYNHVIFRVEGYYNANKHLSRKEFAIGAQEMNLQGIRLLGLAMSLYQDKPADYKAFLKGKYKELGFKDTSVGD